MPKEDTDYNPAIRKEIKADAETGRTFKKWKHRAQGAAVGAGSVVAILGGRKLLKKFSVPETSMSAILGVTTELSLHGGFRDMLESAVKLKKVHVKAWKEMTAKEREAGKAEMRIHRQALSDQESAASDNPFPTFSNYGSCLETTDLDAMNEKHPGDLPMDPATLKRRKLNAGQTGPQSPLDPQDALVRIKSQDGKMHFGEIRHFINHFAADANGKPHSGSGEFEPAVEGVSSQSIQRAYSKNRLTGITPGKSLIKRQIMKRALARVGAISTL